MVAVTKSRFQTVTNSVHHSDRDICNRIRIFILLSFVLAVQALIMRRVWTVPENDVYGLKQMRDERYLTMSTGDKRGLREALPTTTREVRDPEFTETDDEHDFYIAPRQETTVETGGENEAVLPTLGNDEPEIHNPEEVTETAPTTKNEEPETHNPVTSTAGMENEDLTKTALTSKGEDPPLDQKADEQDIWLVSVLMGHTQVTEDSSSHILNLNTTAARQQAIMHLIDRHITLDTTPSFPDECLDWALAIPSHCHEDVDRWGMAVFCQEVCGELEGSAIQQVASKLGVEYNPIDVRITTTIQRKYVNPELQRVHKLHYEANHKERMSIDPKGVDTFIEELLLENTLFPPRQWFNTSDPLYFHPRDVSSGAEPYFPQGTIPTMDQCMSIRNSTAIMALSNFSDMTNLDAMSRRREELNEPRILCVIFTYEKNHEAQLNATLRSYGWSCDGFLAVSNKTDPRLGAINIKRTGGENYNNMWQKMRASWLFIWEQYIRTDEFDWVIANGDDNMVFTGHLRQYLAEYERTHEKHVPALISDVVDYGEGIQHLGGAGAVVNSAAIRLFVSRLHIPSCHPEETVCWEDRLMSKCLGKNGTDDFIENYSARGDLPTGIFQEVWPERSEDKYGRKRFMNFCPQAYGDLPCGIEMISPPANTIYLSGRWIGGPYRAGADCCVEHPLTFHYLAMQEQHDMSAYASCARHGLW